MSNTSFLDQIIRVFLGMIVGGIGGALMNPIGYLAFYLIVTALVGYDPIYHSMRFTTREVDPYKEHEEAEKERKANEKNLQPSFNPQLTGDEMPGI